MRNFLCLLLLVFTTALAEPIAHLPTGSNATISRQEAIWYYTMKTKFWSDGSRVRLVLLPSEHPIHKDFVRGVLGISSVQYKQMVDYSMNSGAATTFIMVSNVSEMLRTVENTPYALGYISRDYLILRGADKSVKILTIID